MCSAASPCVDPCAHPSSVCPKACPEAMSVPSHASMVMSAHEVQTWELVSLREDSWSDKRLGNADAGKGLSAQELTHQSHRKPTTYSPGGTLGTRTRSSMAVFFPMRLLPKAIAQHARPTRLVRHGRCGGECDEVASLQRGGVDGVLQRNAHGSETILPCCRQGSQSRTGSRHRGVPSCRHSRSLQSWASGSG